MTFDPNIETIENESDTTDAWYVCKCGNTPELGGFGACDVNGDLQTCADGSPTKAWDGKHLRCLECHRYFGLADLVVVGHKIEAPKGTTLLGLKAEFHTFQYQQTRELGHDSELPAMDLTTNYMMGGELVTWAQLQKANDLAPDAVAGITAMLPGNSINLAIYGLKPVDLVRLPDLSTKQREWLESFVARWHEVSKAT